MDSNGIVIGIVVDIDDPDGMARVRVKLPYLNDATSQWARLASPMAGPDRGTFFVPEVGDEVLVAYLHGDIRFPYILGSLWNTVDPRPATDGKTSENNWRFIKSRCGHIIKLDDTEGNEKIEILDKSGNNLIVIDTAKNTITVSAGDTIHEEAPKITVKGANSVQVEAPTVEVVGGQKVTVSAPQVEMKAQAQMTIDGGASLTLKAGIIRLN